MPFTTLPYCFWPFVTLPDFSPDSSSEHSLKSDLKKQISWKKFQERSHESSWQNQEDKILQDQKQFSSSVVSSDTWSESRMDLSWGFPILVTSDKMAVTTSVRPDVMAWSSVSDIAYKKRNFLFFRLGLPSHLEYCCESLSILILGA